MSNVQAHVQVHGGLQVALGGRVWGAGCAMVLACVGVAHAAAGFFPTGIAGNNGPFSTGSYVYGLSADGQVVAGWTSTDTASENGFYRSPVTAPLVTFGPFGTNTAGIAVRALAVSSSGRYLAGSTPIVQKSGSANPYCAARYDTWTQKYTHTLTDPDNLVSAPGGNISRAVGISADGNILAGNGTSYVPPGSISAAPSAAFVWRLNPEIGQPGFAYMAMPAGETRAEATGLSDDGRVIAGLADHPELVVDALPYEGGSPYSYTRNVSHAQVWDALTGSVTRLPALSAGDSATRATRVSRNGKHIAGWAQTKFVKLVISPDNGLVPVIWSKTPCGWRAFSPGLPPGMVTAQFEHVSDDGDFAVGWGSTTMTVSLADPKYRAFIWTRAVGFVRLDTLLSGQSGVNLTGWKLLVLRALSADGRTVAGYGEDPSGYNQGFVATLPPILTRCSAADIATASGEVGSDGVLTGSDVVLFFQSFFAGTDPSGYSPADIFSAGGGSGPDCVLTADDIVGFFQAFFAGCVSNP